MYVKMPTAQTFTRCFNRYFREPNGDDDDGQFAEVPRRLKRNPEMKTHFTVMLLLPCLQQCENSPVITEGLSLEV